MSPTPSQAINPKREILKLFPEKSLRAVVEALDELDLFALMYALVSAIEGREFIRERNRIPLVSGAHLVHFQLVAPALRCDIALLEKGENQRLQGNFVDVVDFTLPVRFHINVRIAFSNRDDMPHYTAMRNEARAKLSFVHSQI